MWYDSMWLLSAVRSQMSNYNRISFKERVRIEAGIYAKKSFSHSFSRSFGRTSEGTFSWRTGRGENTLWNLLSPIKSMQKVMKY